MCFINLLVFLFVDYFHNYYDKFLNFWAFFIIISIIIMMHENIKSFPCFSNVYLALNKISGNF